MKRKAHEAQRAKLEVVEAVLRAVAEELEPSLPHHAKCLRTLAVCLSNTFQQDDIAAFELHLPPGRVVITVVDKFGKVHQSQRAEFKAFNIICRPYP
jgi:hypothetical protein